VSRDLHCDFVFLTDDLRVHIAAVEFCHQGMSNIVGFDVSMKNSSVHVFDYNPLYQRRRSVVVFHLSKNIYGMKQFWFKFLLGVFTVTTTGVGIFLTPRQVEASQEASTPTGIIITVTYTDPMNVRNGPGTFYDIIGQIFPGDILPALGISPGREWIQVSFSGGQGGIGWVYAPYVSVSGGELQVVEPPPTPAPLITATIDPTLAAAFNVQPTPTRMPTFTPPPPLTAVQFEEGAPRPARINSGIFIAALGVIGAVGLVVSFVLRR